MDKEEKYFSTKLLAKSGLVSFWTFLSRILGLVRDMVLTGLFGAGASLDAFVVITKIPNVFRRIFAEGAFNQAFVPVLSEYKINKTENEVKALINKTFGLLSSSILILTTLVLLFTPLFVYLFAPGFANDPIKSELAVDILRITFPYLFFVSLVALSGSILNTYDKFSIPALTPLFYNLVIISLALWIAPYQELPIYTIAWGVFVAGFIQVLIQVYPLMKMDLLPAFKIDLNDPGVRKVIYLMVPGIIAGGVYQLNMLVDTILASFLPTGSPTWLYVSDRLTQLPLGIFAIAIATVILPRLSRLHQSDSEEDFSKTLDWSLRLILIIGMPSLLGLYLLAEPIIMILFERGQFTELDTYKASLSLMALCIGLIAFMMIKVLTPAFFSRQDPRTPLKISLAALLVNVLLAWLFAFELNLNHVGLAMASTIAAYFTALTLLIILVTKKIYKINSGWLIFSLRLIFANLCIFFLIHFLNPEMDYWRELELLYKITTIFGLILLTLLSYIVCLRISGLKFQDIKG